MPIHFEFKENDKFPDCAGLKTSMLESKDPVIQRYIQAITANNETELGHGLAAVVYLIGKNSVCYMTTDKDKHSYLSAYLHITDERKFPQTQMTITSWDTERSKCVYIFGAERLFLVEELAPDTRHLCEGRIQKMMILYRELRMPGKEIFVVRDPILFNKFCTLLVAKNSSWKKSLEPVQRWSQHEGHRFPDVILDMKSANVLFKADGTLAYIADPFSHTASASLLREEMQGMMSLSQQQKHGILELMTDFLTEDMSVKQLKTSLQIILKNKEELS
jgi:hypothetical protein